MSSLSLPSLPNPGISDSRKIYILDSSAVLRYLDREAGYDRVHVILDGHAQGLCWAVMTALHWGELAHKLVRRHGESTQESIMAKLMALRIEVIPASADRAIGSARIQARLKIPYVDCFGVELAYDSPYHIFVTADFDLKPAASEVQIEFLPIK